MRDQLTMGVPGRRSNARTAVVNDKASHTTVRSRGPATCNAMQACQPAAAGRLVAACDDISSFAYSDRCHVCAWIGGIECELVPQLTEEGTVTSDSAQLLLQSYPKRHGV